MKTRITLIGFIVTAIALILCSVVSAEIYYANSIDHSKEYLRVYAGTLGDLAPETLTSEFARSASERLGGARVTFLTADGAYLSDSGDGNDSSRADRPEVIAAMRDGEGYDVRSSATVGTELVYYCKNFGSYMVRVALPTSSQWAVFLQSVPSVTVFLALDLALCALFTYLATGYVLRPMERLIREAAAGKRVAPESPELQPIADLINRMNEDADARMKEIDEEKELVVKAQQSKNEFVSNITHEMNTPLTSIKGFAELLSAGALDGERAQKAAQTIAAQSERLTNLVACIINYNEIDNDDLPSYEVNASKIARETLETLAPAIDERKLILLSEIEDDVTLYSRYERVTETFGNLIRNAIRYNREGGSVSVLLTKTEFCVSDTGIGIAEENLERIFDRFFTVDKSHGGKNGGFGLGLAVVKKICKKAGWALSVQSKLGQGTTFRIRFPENASNAPKAEDGRPTGIG
ncbi:MAG: ATP-binding protein [Candidatus Gallimonas sp.]